MKILVDADFLVALNKQNDANFNKAVNKITLFEKAEIFITQFTLPEAVTVLSYKTSHSEAKKFLTEARHNNFTVIELNESLEEKADQIFLAQKKKGTSWIDCLNVAAILTHHLDGILSFDRFYQQAGIKVF